MPTVGQLRKLIKDLDINARVYGPRKHELERIYKCLCDGGDVKKVYKEVKLEVNIYAPIFKLSVPQLRVAIKSIDFEAPVWNLTRDVLENKLIDLRLWKKHKNKIPYPKPLEYGEKYKRRTINDEIKLVKTMLNWTDSDDDIKQIKLWFKLAVMGEFKSRVKSMGGKRQLMGECKLDSTQEQNEQYIAREVAIKLEERLPH